ncbi:TetR/AcrR family transcriptional regulator [Propionibacteriaceae bacterium Y2011]
MPRLKVEDRRAALIEAAITVIGERGTAAATTRGIVAEAGMSLGSFHYAFASRDALFAACFESVAESERDAFEQFTIAADDFRDYARQTFDLYIDLLVRHTDLQLALYELTLYASRHPELRSLPGEYRRHTRELITELVIRGMAQYGIDDDALVAELVNLALTITDGMTIGYVRERDEGALRRASAFASAAIDALLTSSAGIGGQAAVSS